MRKALKLVAFEFATNLVLNDFSLDIILGTAGKEAWDFTSTKESLLMEVISFATFVSTSQYTTDGLVFKASASFIIYVSYADSASVSIEGLY